MRKIEYVVSFRVSNVEEPSNQTLTGIEMKTNPYGQLLSIVTILFLFLFHILQLKQGLLYQEILHWQLMNSIVEVDSILVTTVS